MSVEVVDMHLADKHVQVSEAPGVLPESASAGSRQARPAAPATPAWIEDAKRHLGSLAQLQEDWDGYGAAAPDPDILDSAASLLTSYATRAALPPPSISPTRTGGVLFEWENGPHEIEVQVVSRSAASYVYLNTETDADCSGALFPDSPDTHFFDLMREHFVA